MQMACTTTRSLLTLVAVAFTACQAPTDAGVGDPASLILTVGGTRLRELNATVDSFARFKTAVQVLDSKGRLISDVRPTVVSRNARYVALDSAANIIPGSAPGSAYIVATLASTEGRVLADSLLVTFVCTASSDYGLAIAVTDSLTGNGGPFGNLSLVARGGAYADSALFGALPAQATPFFANLTGTERPGTFDITVRADGYRVWTKTVTVMRDSCHVIRVTVAARLVPQ
jgi:hypothetical protein